MLQVHVALICLVQLEIELRKHGGDSNVELSLSQAKKEVSNSEQFH